ncbi:MAG: hypothetical protein WCK33_00810 [Phycisphaerae bacterium]
MTTNANAAATCTICAGPLSGEKPVTDAKGRPVCAACVERARKAKQAAKSPAKQASAAAKPSSAPAQEDDNAFLLELGGKAQALSGGKPCPQCEQVANQNDRLCLACGYDFESGKKVRTKIEKVKTPKGGPAPKSSGVEFAAIDWILAIPLAGLGTIVGLCWLFSGNPKAKKMLLVSIVAQVIGGVIAAVIQTSMGT